MQRIVQRRYRHLLGVALALFAYGTLLQPAAARFVQQGPKLIGTGAIGQPALGNAVALSADGNTAVIGGPGDASGAGAAWVFTRNNGAWQQEQILIGSNAVGVPQQGISVALSADGNTALVGGYTDNSDVGAAWVFTRNNGNWTQQGPKLIGTGAVGNAKQGTSVALSTDGNTALVGGVNDNSGVGAVWVFTRSNAVWAQQGPKLTANTTGVWQGSSVALSADGNTAISGGPGTNSKDGAAWVFTRSNGTWTQQAQLNGSGNGFSAERGFSVALSADGNTAISGGRGDGNGVGAAWVFTRSNGTWTQQGNKLVGTGAVGVAQQGYSVALSADGNMALIGGNIDNSGAGAAWVFTRSIGFGIWSQQGSKLVGTGAAGHAARAHVALSADGRTAMLGGDQDNYTSGAVWVFFQSKAATHDFNGDGYSGDGYSDIAWRDSSGNTALWMMNGAQVVQSGSVGAVATNWVIAGQRDYNGDGTSDLLWRDTSSGSVAIWTLNGTQIVQTASVGSVPTSWSIVGTGDFNGDGLADILWRNSNGTVALWLMNFSQIYQSGTLGSVPATWTVAGTGDFNGDGKTDILWRDASGNVAVWLMNGLQVLQAGGLSQIATTWSVIGTGDFNGDGNWDILWRDSSGNVAVWLMNGLQIIQPAWLGMVPLNWSVAETGDFNSDGKSDLLWRDASTGTVAIWFMNGTQIAQSASVATVAASWVIQGTNVD
jgi:hypothetical protein